MKTRAIVIGIGIALALTVLLGGGWLLGSQLWAGGCCQSGFGMTGNYGSPWGVHTFGGGILMLLAMVLFWGALIALAAWLVRALFPPAAQSPAPPTGRDVNARDILDRRFARGEISQEEYDLMRETLSQ